MRTLEDMITARSPESQARIAARVQELRLGVTLTSLRYELKMSQRQITKEKIPEK